MKDKLFILLQHLLPQHLLSRLVGRLADCRIRWVKNLFIDLFHRHYGIDMSLAAEENPRAYGSFNEFFTRALKKDARTIDPADDALVSPCDGAVSQAGAISYGRVIQAKGRGYSLTTLLGGNAKRAEPFINGSFATLYLSPRDYHRVHMPVAGTLREAIYVPGDLYSVNNATAQGVDSLFARNERLVTIFDTEYGPMAMILVGAMIVAGIETVWSGPVAPLPRKPQTLYSLASPKPVRLEKGEEMGRFHLGSTVILAFGPDALQWEDSLTHGAGVTLGHRIATFGKSA
ncbi:Phosphatidylserine decarboxylase [Marinobacterium lacunae]|uniref:Phosphatidylserine decarboxylase proenzyme n=1 Tax=Marinobacterium lacunae TaxID=1232683 RepID=A0A081G235_9GAMM|nr:archaetidylserine decarboxylase [Marinobacterium lacunae]KEA64840.1 Phosphatidylserine decarboxylase [Marinobacterium lacunae]MBR9883241.1 phosphatidylserine decarboxylase [Oceanospirillales bacterium]